MAVNEKIRIKIKGYEHATVDAAAAKIVEAAKRSGSQVSGPIPLPTDKEIITILRATHKYKDSREQFERRTHKRLRRGTSDTEDHRGSAEAGNSGRRRHRDGTQVRISDSESGGKPPHSGRHAAVMLTDLTRQPITNRRKSKCRKQLSARRSA